MKYVKVGSIIESNPIFMQNWLKGVLDGSLLYVPSLQLVYLRYEVQILSIIKVENVNELLFILQTKDDYKVALSNKENVIGTENFIYHI